MTRQRHRRSQEALARALADQAPRNPSLSKSEQAVFDNLPPQAWNSYLEPRWVFMPVANRKAPAVIDALYPANMEGFVPSLVKTRHGEPVIQHTMSGALFIRVYAVSGDKHAVNAVLRWYAESPFWGTLGWDEIRRTIVVSEREMFRFKAGLRGQSVEIGAEAAQSFEPGDVVAYLGTEDNQFKEWVIESQGKDGVKARALRLLGGVFGTSNPVTLSPAQLELIARGPEAVKRVREQEAAA